jgi:hypothetical protein
MDRALSDRVGLHDLAGPHSGFVLCRDLREHPWFQVLLDLVDAGHLAKPWRRPRFGGQLEDLFDPRDELRKFE